MEVEEGSSEEEVSRPVVGEGEGVEGVEARAQGAEGLRRIKWGQW